MIQTDNAGYDKAVAGAVLEAIKASPIGSVNGAARMTGIPYTTLHRRLAGTTSFTVSELNRIATLAGCKPSDFLPEVAA